MIRVLFNRKSQQSTSASSSHFRVEHEECSKQPTIADMGLPENRRVSDRNSLVDHHFPHTKKDCLFELSILDGPNNRLSSCWLVYTVSPFTVLNMLIQDLTVVASPFDNPRNGAVGPDCQRYWRCPAG